MPYSTIIVQRKDGNPVKGAKVCLGFSGLLSGGLTNSYYTNSEGEAIIKHKNTGEATLYVNGRNVDSFRTPGKRVITL